MIGWCWWWRREVLCWDRQCCAFSRAVALVLFFSSSNCFSFRSYPPEDAAGLRPHENAAGLKYTLSSPFARVCLLFSLLFQPISGGPLEQYIALLEERVSASEVKMQEMRAEHQLEVQELEEEFEVNRAAIFPLFLSIRPQDVRVRGDILCYLVCFCRRCGLRAVLCETRACCLFCLALWLPCYYGLSIFGVVVFGRAFLLFLACLPFDNKCAPSIPFHTSHGSDKSDRSRSGSS